MNKLPGQTKRSVVENYRRRLGRILVVVLVALAPTLICVQAGETKPNRPPRFDDIVRSDFFAGMMGDQERLDRGMKYCEDILSKDPKHADALVWHGGGLLTRAAKAYRQGDQMLGDALWKLGLKEMNDAVAFQPDNMGIKIGRAATIIGVAQSGWDATDSESRALLESAVADYEKIYELQKPYFGKLSNHSRGELLFGLASGWSILGNNDKARRYLSLITQECAGTDYESEAQKWIRGNPETVIQHDCRGCHR